MVYFTLFICPMLVRDVLDFFGNSVKTTIRRHFSLFQVTGVVKRQETHQESDLLLADHLLAAEIVHLESQLDLLLNLRGKYPHHALHKLVKAEVAIFISIQNCKKPVTYQTWEVGVLKHIKFISYLHLKRLLWLPFCCFGGLLAS
jgi:hypothetical protein